MRGSPNAKAHRALHPFGQIPTYEEGDLVLFESGAIVLHIAENHAGLLPAGDANARARAIAWMFAALSTVEPPILDLQNTNLLEKNERWYEQRLPMVEERIRGCVSWMRGWEMRRGSMGRSARGT